MSEGAARGDLCRCECGGWYFDDERGRAAHTRAIFNHGPVRPTGEVWEQDVPTGDPDA